MRIPFADASPWVFSAAFLALSFPGTPPCVAADVAAAPTLLEIASDPILERALYADPTRLLSGVGQVNEFGAVAENAGSGGSSHPAETSPMNLEAQRWGADLVQASLAMRKDPTAGLNVTLYGLSHERSDGSFGPENDFQHVSFFLEGAARTFLLLRQAKSPLFETSGKNAIPKLELAAERFIQSGDLKKQEEKGLLFTHRFYLAAAALGEVAALTGNPAFADQAMRLARKGLAQAKADGTNPEKGGFDLNYNAASALFAERYYLVCPDHELRLNLKNMIRASLRREQKAVLPNGDLSLSGSTRAGVDAKHDGSGQVKGKDTKGILQAFVLGASIEQVPEFGELAKKIAEFRGWWK